MFEKCVQIYNTACLIKENNLLCMNGSFALMYLKSIALLSIWLCFMVKLHILMLNPHDWFCFCKCHDICDVLLLAIANSLPHCIFLCRRRCIYHAMTCAIFPCRYISIIITQWWFSLFWKGVYYSRYIMIDYDLKHRFYERSGCSLISKYDTFLLWGCGIFK